MPKPSTATPQRSGRVPFSPAAAVFLALACAGLLGGCGGSTGGSAGRGGDRSSEVGPTVRVTRVVDGDTIVVSLDGRSERVRYIGVDTPETVKPNTPVQCYGKKASQLNRSLVEGRTVTLSFDRERTDRYGRLLAYVTRSDGLDVNAALLKNGAARTIEIRPNTSRARSYRALESKARSEQRGMWRMCGGSQVSGASLVLSTR